MTSGLAPGLEQYLAFFSFLSTFVSESLIIPCVWCKCTCVSMKALFSFFFFFKFYFIFKLYIIVLVLRILKCTTKAPKKSSRKRSWNHVLLGVAQNEIYKLKGNRSIPNRLPMVKCCLFVLVPLLMETKRNWLHFIMRDQSLLLPLGLAVIAFNVMNSFHIQFWWGYDAIP